MDHKAILNRLKLCIQLLELHDENPFKIRSYQGGLNALERLDQDLMAMNLQDLAAIPGIGKSILEAIQSLKETGSFPALDALIGQTPAGVLEILQVKGLGPKKVQVLWKELGLTSTHELMEACQSGKVAQTKGFGEKTQETIIQSLLFKASTSGKWLYADIEEAIDSLANQWQQQLAPAQVRIVGDFARRLEIISEGEYLIASTDLHAIKSSLTQLAGIAWDKALSGPMTWRGKLEEPELQLVIHFCSPEELASKELLFVASKAHLSNYVNEQETVSELIRKSKFESEADFFQLNNLQFIPREMREGMGEVEQAMAGTVPVLLEVSFLRLSMSLRFAFFGSLSCASTSNRSASPLMIFSSWMSLMFERFSACHISKAYFRWFFCLRRSLSTLSGLCPVNCSAIGAPSSIKHLMEYSVVLCMA